MLTEKGRGGAPAFMTWNHSRIKRQGNLFRVLRNDNGNDNDSDSDHDQTRITNFYRQGQAAFRGPFPQRLCGPATAQPPGGLSPVRDVLPFYPRLPDADQGPFVPGVRQMPAQGLPGFPA